MPRLFFSPTVVTARDLRRTAKGADGLRPGRFGPQKTPTAAKPSRESEARGATRCTARFPRSVSSVRSVAASFSRNLD